MPSLTETLATLPPEWPRDVLPEIRRRLDESKQIVVVLDDDPTGTQTVHDIPVLTEWAVDTLAGELNRGTRAFYILTNTRAMTGARARAVNADVATNLAAASRASTPTAPRTAKSPAPGDEAFILLSRSDSTLRGHFPGEVDALRTDRTARAPTLLVPAFFAGGRYTIDDVHYVANGDALVPAGDTEFAKDAAFGYRASNLREWVEEKTGGRVKAAGVTSISINEIRTGGPEAVLAALKALPPEGVCVINAAAERDLEVVALAAAQCEADGRPLLYRTAASFARARAGIPPKALLTSQTLAGFGTPRGLEQGGLIVVGSYVPKTSGQLDALLATGIYAVEVDVPALLSDATHDAEIDHATECADDAIANGRDVVVYTSRALVTGDDAASSLVISNRVSAALIAIVRGLTHQPRFVIAKGGITSSDVATKGLNVKRAMVLGQVLPGVPVWQLGPESRYPHSLYVVFPGNVGGPEALVEAWGKMRG